MTPDNPTPGVGVDDGLRHGDKRAPVQGLEGGIPWSLHLKAYEAYSKRYRPQPALIDLEGRNCRGGFGTEELDSLIPGWRDELSEITALKSRLALRDRQIAGLVDERNGELKEAFVAGCCAVLTWTHSGMPQDDLDEAGYDYVASLVRSLEPKP